jgi:hypothetical protein
MPALDVHGLALVLLAVGRDGWSSQQAART